MFFILQHVLHVLKLFLIKNKKEYHRQLGFKEEVEQLFKVYGIDDRAGWFWVDN